jgi:ribose transport system ATP-binding protein
LLSAEGLEKRFGATRALDKVGLEIQAGEVHGLLGENGSGKSTLIKVLSGVYVPDAGRLQVRGQDVALPLWPGQSRRIGMDFVHQDLGLISSLSVAENLLIDELAAGEQGTWYLPERVLNSRADSILQEFSVNVDPSVPVRSLTPVERALVAIVRAIHGLEVSAAGADHRAGLLVLDEPTVFLPRRDIEHLFALIRDIVSRGNSVLFVSHDLDEVMEVTTAVTVLRDGRAIGTRRTSEIAKSELIEMIIGRRIDAVVGRASTRGDTAPVLELRGIGGKSTHEVTLAVHGGEILGITGLVGSGFEEIPYLVYGAGQETSGSVLVDGRSIPAAKLTPSVAMSLGMVLLPADRRRHGSIGALDITDNTTMPVLARYFRGGRLARREMRAETQELLRRYDVRPADPDLLYRMLSGGNQQKALLAKWLRLDPRILLLHEPTQGVDVGARQQIFEVVRRAAERGSAILCASSDYEELATICDRVLVFARGKIAVELSGDDVSKDHLTHACYESLTAGQVN